MNSNRLGCLSPLAIIATILTLVVIGIVMYSSGSGFFTAGSLNAQPGQMLGGVTSHAEIGNDCARCHPTPWGAQDMTNLCVTCHSSINTQMSDPASLHGAMSGGKHIECLACHPEHNGPQAALTYLDSAKFPHEQIGYSLKAHARKTDSSPFTCADCHGANISKFELSTCETCHRQMDVAFATAHTLAYGNGCLACHDGIDTYNKNFDHSRLAFKLDGKHTEILCSQCHLNARSRTDLQNTPANCGNCHIKEDAHNGQFGRECSACHTTGSWKPATFDHNLSAFKLDGAHAGVQCAECHKNEVFKDTPTRCDGCHTEPTLHSGMFPGQSCADCHTTSAWSPARYNGPHTFPMNHGEKNNTCADCHQPTLNQWTCDTCHQPAEVRAKHIEEGITDFTDCLRCHPTGQEGDD